MRQARVAWFVGAGRPLELAWVPVPDPGPGEVSVRLRRTTICASDGHTVSGRRAGGVPMILGHESFGDVVEAGEGAEVWLGRRVTWSIVWNCGECFFCTAGLPMKCERLRKFGHEVGSLYGGLAEYCVLPAGSVIREVPEGVPDRVASLANCAVATAAAALRVAGEVRGGRVLVLGAGMLGLAATAMLREAGAAEVLVVEPDEGRRARVARFGGVEEGEGIANGYDAAFDFAGRPEAVEQALPRLRAGGRMVLAGAVFPGRGMVIDGEMLVRRMLRMEGIHNYRPEDLEAALAFLGGAGQKYPFGELVSADFGLEEVNAAMAAAGTGEHVRVAVVMGAKSDEGRARSIKS